MRSLGIFLSVFTISTQVLGFIPPVSGMVREVFEDRRPTKVVEVTLRHRIDGRVELEERLLVDKGRGYFIWRIAGQSAVSGSLSSKGYEIQGQSFLPSRSSIVNRYWGSNSPDEFEAALLREGFIRKDQLMQYKPSFNPTGDPQTWNARENYLLHSDISFIRVGGVATIGVLGTENAGNRRAIYFDKGLKGVRALEWKEDGQRAAWIFRQFEKMGGEGYYPRFSEFEVNGNVRVQTETLSVRALKDKSLSEFQASFKQANQRGNLNETIENALKVLLSFR